MSRASATLAKIRRACQASGVTLADAATEGARQRADALPLAQLRRALPRYGVRLTEQEYEELALEFGSGGGVSLAALAAAVEGSAARAPPARPEAAADLRALARELALRRETVWDAAKAYSRRNGAVIAGQAFVRAFGAQPWAQALAAAFADRDRGEIALAELEAAIAALPAEARAPDPPQQPPQVRAVIDSVLRRAVEIRGALEGHDRLRKGKLPIHLFAMVISNFSGTQLSPSDLETVAAFYSTKGVADYLAFLKDVHEAGIRARAVPPSPKAAVEIDVAKLLRTLRELFAERRIAPRSLFPPDGTGVIPRYAFERILAQTTSLLTTEEIWALSNAFSAGNNKVNYEDFVAAFVRRRPDPEDISPVLAIIRNALTEHKLQLRPELVKLARNAGDDVSRTQLIVALQNSSIVLGTREIDGLLREFPGTNPGTVSIDALCDAVDPVLLLPLPQPSAPRSPRRQTVSPMRVPEAVNHFGRLAATLGVDLEQEFRRLDRLQRGRVTEAQFASVIGLINRRITEKELRVVYTQYLLNDGFDYLSFCRDATLRVVEPRRQETEELFAVLRKCKALLASRIVPLDLVLKRLDPAGAGCVPVSAICKAFGENGLALTPPELALIADGFRDRRQTDKVNCMEFQRRLQGIEIPREEHEVTLHKDWTEEEYQRVLSGVKTELREKLHVRPRALRRLMATVRQGVVSESAFLQAIEDSGVILKKEQIAALIHCYRVPHTGNIDFVRFTQEVERTDLLGAR